jgi:hypothetical protein
MSDDGNFWTGVVVAAALAGSLYYCNWEDEPANDYQSSEQNYTEEATAASASDELPEPITPPAPQHNYAEKDGANYYYLAALTEEEEKRGKSSGNVLTVQYGGKNKDEGHIVFIDGWRTTCSVPCKIIKFSDGTLSRYDEVSVISLAFQDAMGGFLKVPPKPKPQPINEEPWADYNNAPVASESSGSSLNTPMNSAEAPIDESADKVQ